jgi:hypothetical protein
MCADLQKIRAFKFQILREMGNLGDLEINVNLRWMDGVMRDAERLGVRNWRSKVKDRDGWRRFLESAKTLHEL